MTKDEIRQMVTEVSDKLYNNPYNLSAPVSELNSAVETISAIILNDIENLIVEVLYEMQEQE